MSQRDLFCRISTEIKGADSPKKIFAAILNIFPETEINEENTTEPSFPVEDEDQFVSLTCNNIEEFIEKISNQRILDTAMDAMTHNLNENDTWFYISRQAALANKIAFSLNHEFPLGGKIKIELSKEDLPLWIEDITWHIGRDEIPRHVGDDYTMRKDGLPREWFRKN